MSSTDSTPVANTASVSQLNALGEQLKSLKNTVATLEKSFKEASKEVAKTIKDATKAKKAKRERKGDYVPSEGQKAWNAYVASVRSELQKANTAATYKDAMIEAKRRREAGDSAAPKTTAAKKAPKAKAAAAPVAAAPVAVAAPAATTTAAPAKAKAAPKAKVIKA
jgi:chromosome segregation ATPase